MSTASTKKITVFSFGRVAVPIQVEAELGALETCIKFNGSDLVSLLGCVESGFYSTNFRTRTQRQRDIIEYCSKLIKLLKKEKNISGIMWSQIFPIKKETEE